MDPLTTLFAAFPELTKRAIELFKIGEKRVDRRFEQFWRPIYGNLQDVHRDYLRMFAEVEDILLRSPSAGDGDLDSYSAAVRYLRTNRVALATVRDELNALDVLRTNPAHVSKLTQPEREFLHCLVRYIRPISLPDGDTSRSASLQRELRKADAKREALEELSATDALDRMQMPERVERLSDDWRRAAEAFQALQLSVINRST